MPSVSLETLQHQITQHERELQTLRRELESRQSQLGELTRRKEELLSQLQQVEAEIAAFNAAAAAPTQPPMPAAPVGPAEGQPRLGEMVVTLLGDSAAPMTARQLSEELLRRGYRPASRDPVRSVEARVQELKHQGIVQRAAGQPGYILAASADRAKADKGKPRAAAQASAAKAAAKQGPAAPKSSGKAAPSAETAKTAKTRRRGGQPPLREVLTAVLKNSRKPLSGSELAQRALETGYQSTSKNFRETVWAMLRQMTNVEHLPRKGYRLKKS